MRGAGGGGDGLVHRASGATQELPRLLFALDGDQHLDWDVGPEEVEHRPVVRAPGVRLDAGLPEQLQRRLDFVEPMQRPNRSEQPASASGISTVFSGERIAEVSAIKWTPLTTSTGAGLRAANCAMPSESPT